MKSLIGCLFLVIAGTTLHAQITLTNASSSPVVGNSFNYVFQANPTLDFRQGGADQTWDFSAVTGVAGTLDYIDLASASEPGSFPLATVVETASVGENYYSASASGLLLEGHYLPGIGGIQYNDKREFLVYPITYNDVFNETFDGLVQNIPLSQTYDRSGTIEIIADGYGDIIMPYGTINNVLRVRASLEYVDRFFGLPIANYTDTIWTWYNSSTNTFIANVSVGYISGFQAVFQATHLQESDIVITSIDDVSAVENIMTVYPNPAQEFIMVQSSDNTPLEIIDSRGILIRRIEVSNINGPIDVSDLTPGIYFIKQTSADFSGAKLFFIQGK